MPCCPARPLARGPMTSPNRMLTHCGGRNGDKTRNRIATPLPPSSLAASGCQLRPGADPGANCDSRVGAGIRSRVNRERRSKDQAGLYHPVSLT